MKISLSTFCSQILRSSFLVIASTTFLIGANPPTIAQSPDWLIAPESFVAEVKVAEQGKRLDMSNGLLRRSFRITPNAATIALDHLVTGESLLRGVKPEAEITVDGQKYEVGGLTGQPNLAFLTPEWLEQMKSSPTALQFSGYEIGKPVERFRWKRVRHHAGESKWPPPGVSLRLDFTMPTASSHPNLPSAAGRPTILNDTFTSLSDQWKISRSNAAERISFQNEGKPGEIYSLPGKHCFANYSLSQPVSLVETVIDPGTDQDTSWGPGLTLSFPKRTVKVNLRPGDRGVHGHFELRDNGNESLISLPKFAATDGGLDTGRTYRLRVRIEKDQLVWEVTDASNQATPFTKLFSLEHDGSFPTSFSVGKTDRRGSSSDSDSDAQSTNWTRCRISSVAAYGAFDPKLLKAAEAALQKDLLVSVHYEMYDGLPCYCKWITLTNRSEQPITIDSYSSELLAAVEFVSEVDELSVGRTPPNFHIETDMSFGGMTSAGANRRSYRWQSDPDFHTQVNYEKKTPCLLNVGPDLGPSLRIAKGEAFESYRAWVLPQDSTDRERNGLAVRRLFRTISPWATENPLMMHLIASDTKSVFQAIDQCAEIGFEMLILSFGSGFNMENRSPATIEQARKFSDYAKSKGIEIGSYSLLASRRISVEDDVVMPEGLKPIFGNSPCLQSDWGIKYFQRLFEFHRNSGFTLLEHDGSYPGDPCASEKHPGHNGLADSRWQQWKEISEFYRWCRSEGIYLNVPDHYFLSGSNKTGMGYREVNWSLPREQQVIHTRQNIYDGTWEKLPSMGWMFVPLTQYHGGGAAATIEPLSEHLDHYARMLDSNLALGVQACYRGPRLFDTDTTRDMVKEKVRWFKEHRDILESDLIHGRRADAREPDWMMHVNPKLEKRALIAVFNPQKKAVQRNLKIPLYYSGLTGSARVEDSHGNTQTLKLDRDYSIVLSVDIAAEGMSWYVVRP
ncbi:MAG: hypothetical protein RLY14_2096 [Planctomycetota bacterium]|jgi:hypothetical protein